MGSSTSKQEVRQKPLPPATAEQRQLRDPRRTRASQTGRKTRTQSLTPACGGLRSSPMDTTQRNLPEPRSVKKQMPCSSFLLRPEKGAIVPAALGRLIQLMQRSLLSLLVAFIAILAARDTRADSTFAGSLVSGNNEGYIAGSISLTVDRDQVFFTSTLFQPWVSGTILEPVLVVHNKVFPLPFGTGTPGSWPFQEFLWPFPGPAPCGPPVGIDPGFGRPLMFDGTRFTGSFTTHPDLEQSLLTKGGTVLLQVHGTVNSLQDPPLLRTPATRNDPDPDSVHRNPQRRQRAPAESKPISQ